MRSNFNNRLLFILLLMVSIPLSSDPGDFIKDVKIPKLDWKIPQVQVIRESELDSVYAIPDKEFPIESLEFHFYTSTASLSEDESVETADLMAATWELSGTKNLPGSQFLNRLESLGANLSVEAGYEKVIVSVSYLSPFRKEIHSMLKDFFQNSDLETSALEIAKRNAIGGIQRRNDNPSSMAVRKLKELVYKGTPKGRVSQIDSVTKIQLSDLKKFRKLVLAGKRAVLASGNIQTKSLPIEIDQILPKPQKLIPYRQELTTKALKENLESLPYNLLEIEKESAQSMVLLAGILPPHNSSDFYAIQVLNYIIGGGGFTSYFMREIREEKGLAYGAGSSADFGKEYGVLFFYAQTKRESSTQVLDLMKKILTEERLNNISQKELEIAQDSIINKFIFLFTSPMQILEIDLSLKEDNMPNGYLQNYRDKISAVTLDDLKRVGKEYFLSGKLKGLAAGNPEFLPPVSDAVRRIGPEDSIP